MKLSIDPVLASRARAAWAKLPPDQQSRIIPLVMAAHQQVITASQSKVAPPADARLGHGLNFLFTALKNDLDGVLDSLEAGVTIGTDDGGEIWGTGKYEQLDPGWLEAGVEWLEDLAVGNCTFNTNPATIPIPDDVQIGLAGDWGTGDWRTPANPSPSTDVLKHMAFLQPNLTIHLGDVYYAGTQAEEQHILTGVESGAQQMLTAGWPKGSVGSLALNSNHEMYSGGGPYFKAISGSPFEVQKGCSYFALENNYWVIVGLDSAYYADPEGLYRDGALFSSNGPQTQLDFLRAQVATGKRIIILTHHNGLAQDGSSPTNLWEQVMSAFPLNTAPAYWYWGHVHCGAVYNPQTKEKSSVLCRCCGHGGLPCGSASVMVNNGNVLKPNVLWYENRSAHDPDIPLRVLNGFGMLYLHGSEIDEVFYDENGGTAWASTGRALAGERAMAASG
jgi:hypothetical protein